MKSFIKSMKFIPAIMAVATIYAGCTKGPDIKTYEYPAPEPTGMFPGKGYPGIDVTINGAKFGDYKNAVKVFFNGIEADTIRTIEDGKIVVKVPADAISGKVSLHVWNHTIDSIGSYTVLPYPIIKFVNNTAGLPGDTILIAGVNFGAELEKVHVNFNGTAGEVSELKDTLITVVVPPTFETGNIVLTVDDYTVNGPDFRRLAPVGNPIYWLDFEENLVDRISGVAATYNKGSAPDLTYESGKSGKAARFPGFTPIAPAKWNSSGSVSIDPAINPATVFRQREFTVSCWVNWAEGRDIYPDPIFEFGELRGTRIAFLTRMGSGSNNWNGTQRKMVARYLLEKKVSNPTTGEAVNHEEFVGALNAPGMLPTNTWKHVALVFSYANLNMKLYIDGEEFGTKAFSRSDIDPFLMNIKKASVGGYSFGSGSETAFSGLIDEFKFFNEALNADQIYTLYYKNK